MAHDGVKDCGNYIAKVGEIDHKCCGGRITKYAVVNCKKRGRVNARDECKESCAFCTLSKTKSMSPSDESKVLRDDGGWGKIVSLVETEKKDSKVDNRDDPEQILDKIWNDRKSFWQKWADEIDAENAKKKKVKSMMDIQKPNLDWRHFHDEPEQ